MRAHRRARWPGLQRFVPRFRNKARRTAALPHPNIAMAYDYGESGLDDGLGRLASLVMELVEGSPLVTLSLEESTLPVEWTLHASARPPTGSPRLNTPARSTATSSEATTSCAPTAQ